MSDIGKVKFTLEHHDELGHFLDNRLRIFRGELEQAANGEWTGIVSPLYNPLQTFEVCGEINLTTGKINLEAKGPVDLDCMPWDPQPTYRWVINHDGKTTWYGLPDHYIGQVPQTADGVWMGEVDRDEGKAGIQLTRIS